MASLTTCGFFNQPRRPAGQDRQHGGKYSGRQNKISPAKDNADQLQAEEHPAKRANRLWIVARHAAHVPSQKCREKQIGCTKQTKAAVEISIAVTLAAKVEPHSIHRLLYGSSLRCGRLELQKTECVPGRKQDQNKCGDTVEQCGGH